MDLLFYVSAIKINVDGYRTSQWHNIFGHNVNMQLIKIPTTSYVNATLNIWGHDFTRNREGELFNLEPMGKIQMSKVKPIKWSTMLENMTI